MPQQRFNGMHPIKKVLQIFVKETVNGKTFAKFADASYLLSEVTDITTFND